MIGSSTPPYDDPKDQLLVRLATLQAIGYINFSTKTVP